MPIPISTPYPLRRAAAWDFCYLYFYRNRGSERLKGNLERSCLSLGMYLANFGMYRGSSSLMKYSCRIYIPIIKWIDDQDKARPWLWEFDFCKATNDQLEDLIIACKELEAILEAIGISATGTLVSKIMLGVFGCMPALDTNVREETECTEDITIKNLQKIQAKCTCVCGLCSGGPNPLPESFLELSDFPELPDCSEWPEWPGNFPELPDFPELPASVIDFYGRLTGIPYPSARILDHHLWSNLIEK